MRLIFLALLISCNPAVAQLGLNANYLSLNPTTLPTLCKPGDMRFDSVSFLIKTCNAVNTWTAVNYMTAPISIANGGTGSATTSQNYIFAGPTSGSGAPSFRAMVAGDVPTLNQNTTGTAASFTGSLTGDVTSTGMSTTVGKINGTSMAGLSTGILKNTTVTGVPSIAVAGDFPTLNQNTTGTAANVTGTVAIANGGTGQTSASAAFNAISPVTTAGDLIIGNGSNSATRLAIGANTYVLTSNGSTATWEAPASGSSDKISRASVNNVCSSSPCTKTSSSNVGTITRNSAGIYTVNFSVAYSTVPSCTCSALNRGSATTQCKVGEVATSNYPTVSSFMLWTYYTDTFGSYDYDTPFQIICVGTP